MPLCRLDLALFSLRPYHCRCRQGLQSVPQPAPESPSLREKLTLHSVWRWRNQYGEVLGGLGTGIGEGDRGVVCGREAACCGAKEHAQETDCDAEDAKDNSTTPWVVDALVADEQRDQRTPSPQLGPGYERHEIVGIGGVKKKLLLRMVRVGACVPEWPDEKTKGEILGRERRGETRSWCGWCWRIVPGAKDREGVK